MDEILYEHEKAGRLPVAIATLVLAVVVVIAGAMTDAPLLWYMPMGFVLLFASWYFMSNPVHGCRLTRELLELRSGETLTAYPLPELAAVTVTRATDGNDTITVELKNGSREPLAPQCVGDAESLVAQLEELGVAVNRDV